MTEPDNMVLHLLRDMRAEMAGMRGEMVDMRADLNQKIENVRDDLRSEMRSLRADVASDLMTLEKRLGDQIAGLRRSVMEYHSSAIGHGVLISEFEERLRRVEQRLGMTPPEPH